MWRTSQRDIIQEKIRILYFNIPQFILDVVVIQTLLRLLTSGAFRVTNKLQHNNTLLICSIHIECNRIYGGNQYAFCVNWSPWRIKLWRSIDIFGPVGGKNSIQTK